jgi:hypothetical protein
VVPELKEKNRYGSIRVLRHSNPKRTGFGAHVQQLLIKVRVQCQREEAQIGRYQARFYLLDDLHLADCGDKGLPAKDPAAVASLNIDLYPACIVLFPVSQGSKKLKSTLTYTAGPKTHKSKLHQTRTSGQHIANNDHATGLSVMAHGEVRS